MELTYHCAVCLRVVVEDVAFWSYIIGRDYFQEWAFCDEHHFDGSYLRVVDPESSHETEASCLLDLVRETTESACLWRLGDLDRFLGVLDPDVASSRIQEWSSYDLALVKLWTRRAAERAGHLLEPRRGRPPKSLTEGTLRLA